MSYAANTEVPVERTKAEIETTLTRYGASEFVSGWSAKAAQIGFKCNGRFVRFVLPLPAKDDFTHKAVKTGGLNNRTKKVPLSPEKQYKAWEQACRQKWRALALCIKAKLEACDAGITTFDDEFLAHLVIPGGGTVSQWLVPQLEEAYTSGQMPGSLLALPPGGGS